MPPAEGRERGVWAGQVARAARSRGEAGAAALAAPAACSSRLPSITAPGCHHTTAAANPTVHPPSARSLASMASQRSYVPSDASMPMYMK